MKPRLMNTTFLQSCLHWARASTCKNAVGNPCDTGWTDPVHKHRVPIYCQTCEYSSTCPLYLVTTTHTNLGIQVTSKMSIPLGQQNITSQCLFRPKFTAKAIVFHHTLYWTRESYILVVALVPNVRIQNSTVPAGNGTPLECGIDETARWKSHTIL